MTFLNVFLSDKENQARKTSKVWSEQSSESEEDISSKKKNVCQLLIRILL